MSNLINFFFSFDKLMKEGLVRAFYWLALIKIGLTFVAKAFDTIHLGPLADVIQFVLFFVTFLLAIVALRLAAELAIALFRINDNLSPDGGKSETANIDPVAEARKAAEMAAKRASDVTKSAVDKTKGKESEPKAASPESVKSKPKAQPIKKEPVKKAPVKKAPTKKTPAKKPAAAKKAAPKKATPKTATKTPAAKKPAAPRKKPAPKSTPKT